ncbi:MAG: hypothetical protein AAF713_10265 [Pseudomonadota bacterium]
MTEAAAETVFILQVEVGRAAEDGLPDGADGAVLICYAAGRDEKHAVDETVAVLRQAGLAPLEVESYGTADEAAQGGLDFGAEDRALMDRAQAENAVIVANVTTLTPED